MPRTRVSKVRTTFADWGMAYKVALGVMAVGVLLIVWSPFVGESLYNQALVPLIELLGAPEERGFLPRTEPQTGIEILALFGFCNLVVGICMFGVRFVLELLKLAGEPALTRRMMPRGKLASGAAAAGVVVFAASALPDILISQLFVANESAVLGITSALDTISKAGLLLILCAGITLILRGRGIRGRLFSWADTVGWARLGWGWINRLSVAMVAAGMLGALPFLPFEDIAAMFANTGVTVLTLGIIPQLLSGRNP